MFTYAGQSCPPPAATDAAGMRTETEIGRALIYTGIFSLTSSPVFDLVLSVSGRLTDGYFVACKGVRLGTGMGSEFVCTGILSLVCSFPLCLCVCVSCLIYINRGGKKNGDNFFFFT